MDDEELTPEQRERLEASPGARFSSDEEIASREGIFSDYEIPEWLKSTARGLQEFGEMAVPGGITRRAQVAVEGLSSDETDAQRRRRIAGDVEEGREQRPVASIVGGGAGLASGLLVPGGTAATATRAGRAIRGASRVLNPMQGVRVAPAGASAVREGLRRGAVGAAQGAAEGAASGFGLSSEESFGGQVADAARGLGYGASGGAVLGGTGGALAARRANRAARGADPRLRSNAAVSREQARVNRVAAAEARSLGASPAQINQLTNAARRSGDSGGNVLTQTMRDLRDAGLYQTDSLSVASLRQRLGDLAQGAAERVQERLPAPGSQEYLTLTRTVQDAFGNSDNTRSFFQDIMASARTRNPTYAAAMQQAMSPFHGAGSSRSYRQFGSSFDPMTGQPGPGAITSYDGFRDAMRTLGQRARWSEGLSTMDGPQQAQAEAARELWANLRARETQMIADALSPDQAEAINRLRSQQSAFMTAGTFNPRAPSSLIAGINSTRFGLMGILGGAGIGASGVRSEEEGLSYDPSTPAGLLTTAAAMYLLGRRYGDRASAATSRGTAAMGRRFQELPGETRFDSVFRRLNEDHPHVYAQLVGRPNTDPEGRDYSGNVGRDLEDIQRATFGLEALREEDPELFEEMTTQLRLVEEDERRAQESADPSSAGSPFSDEEFEEIFNSEVSEEVSDEEPMGDDVLLPGWSDAEFDRMLEQQDP